MIIIFKIRNNFYLVTEDSTCVIEIQLSQWNQLDSGKFTINLGRNFPIVEKVLRAKILDRIPKAGQCTIQTRVGSIVPQPRDIWWEVNENTDTNLLSKQVRMTVENFAFQWLDQVSTLAGVKKVLGHFPSLEMTSICLLLNQPEVVSKQLLELIETKLYSAEYIKHWALRNNISLAI